MIVLAAVGVVGVSALPGSLRASRNEARAESANVVGTQTCRLSMSFLTYVTTSDASVPLKSAGLAPAAAVSCSSTTYALDVPSSCARVQPDTANASRIAAPYRESSVVTASPPEGRAA